MSKYPVNFITHLGCGKRFIIMEKYPLFEEYGQGWSQSELRVCPHCGGTSDLIHETSSEKLYQVEFDQVSKNSRAIEKMGPLRLENLKYEAQRESSLKSKKIIS